MREWLTGRLAQFIVLAMLAVGGAPAGAAIWNWSTTAGSNATADPSINWAEGMSPSSVNDSARAMMAVIAAWRNDISASNTTGGTSSAYTLTTAEGVTSTPTTGQMISFIAHTSNAVNATLTVDGGTTYNLKIFGANIPAATLVANTPYRVSFIGGAWVLEAGYASSYNIPLGGYLESSVNTAPNSNFVAADGSCISRTTYAAYFALVSTTYGACDGVSTFGVPDRRGRVAAMLDGGANRLTNAATGCGTAFTTMGVSCANGAQSNTLVTSNLPPYTPSGSVASTPSTGSRDVMSSPPGNTGSVPGGGALLAFFIAGTTSTALTVSSTFTGTAQGGTSTAFSNVPPNYGVAVFVRIF